MHKRNVLHLTEGLFLREVRAVAQAYPEVALEEQLVDSMAALLVREGARYDVVVTTNMFGDILSDQAAELSGSIGLAASINAGEAHCMAQAQHGSAPELAGRDLANPASLVLSAGMLLGWLARRHAREPLAAAERAIEALRQAVTDGFRNYRFMLLDPRLGRRFDFETLVAVTREPEDRLLDALEARYPMLRGTMRDHVTKVRRPKVRFYACMEDITHDSPDTPLPAAIPVWAVITALVMAAVTGMLFGTTMFLNVWGVIWRAQKVVIGSARSVAEGGEANPDAPAAASPTI